RRETWSKRNLTPKNGRIACRDPSHSMWQAVGMAAKLSIASEDSFLSIASTRSFLSIGSVGSFASIGSIGTGAVGVQCIKLAQYRLGNVGAIVWRRDGLATASAEPSPHTGRRGRRLGRNAHVLRQPRPDSIKFGGNKCRIGGNMCRIGGNKCRIGGG